ncbi:MAG: RNA polymerase sporulation sigma factor SigK [Clostridia bacterium]|nr:RNA polymerase sporulation sigma factor SigK [Clostridia bacterium]
MFELIRYLFQNFLFFALHLGNGSSFPKALSPAEEKKLLVDFKEKGDSNARNKLIEHNLRLVAHVIKKYYALSSDQDDLISMGTIGLIKAIDTFEHTKGTRLATYAARCIENEILMHFRSLKKSSSVVSLADPIDVDSEGNPLTLIDLIYSDNTIVEDIDLNEKTKRLYELIEEMEDSREKEIIISRYGLYDNEELTQKEIAKKLGISRSYVSRIEKKVIEDIKRKF